MALLTWCNLLASGRFSMIGTYRQSASQVWESRPRNILLSDGDIEVSKDRAANYSEWDSQGRKKIRNVG